MTENMQKFLTAVTQNDEMYGKINGAAKDELIAMAKALGIELTEADFEQKTAELNDDELDTVAGGYECYCELGGGGTGGQYEKTCACVLGGGGEWKSGECRCACVLAGAGKGTEL